MQSKKQNNKIFAVVPTYNRPILLRKNLDCLLKQTLKLKSVVIVDNGSSQETFNFLLNSGYLENNKIIYKRLEINKGASFAFSYGMKFSLNQGADMIWAMDDDAFAKNNALEILVKEYKKNPGHIYWSNCNKQIKSNITEVDFFMFVGFLIDRQTIKKVGFPDASFFMYHDDTDYSIRIRNLNKKIFRVQNSIINHNDWTSRNIEEIKVLNIFCYKIKLYCGDKVRLYYIARNEFFLSVPVYKKIKFLLKAFIRAFLYLILSPKHFPAYFKGIIHGALLNRRGKLIE